MSQENVEIAKRCYEAYADGGIEAALTFFAPDVVAYPFPEWVEESEYQVHDGLRDLIAVWAETFDGFDFHNQEYHEVGDRVLILGETAGRIKGSWRSDPTAFGGRVLGFPESMIGETRNFQSESGSSLSEQRRSCEARAAAEDWPPPEIRGAAAGDPGRLPDPRRGAFHPPQRYSNLPRGGRCAAASASKVDRLGRRAPYGLKSAGGQLEANPAEAAVVAGIEGIWDYLTTWRGGHHPLDLDTK